MTVRHRRTRIGYTFEVLAEHRFHYVVLLPNGNLSVVSKTDYMEVQTHDVPTLSRPDVAHRAV